MTTAAARRRRLATQALLTAVALLPLAACGSTVAQHGSAAAAGTLDSNGAGSGLAAPARGGTGAVAGGTDGTTGATGPAAGSAAGGGSAGTGTTTGVTGGQAAPPAGDRTAPAAQQALAPGITAD